MPNHAPQYAPVQYAPQNNDEWYADFENTPVHEGNLIPNGSYRIMLEKVNQERTKDSNKPICNCQFTITDNKQHNRKVFMGFMPSEPYQVGQVKALGVATGKVLKNGNIYQALFSMMNIEFLAVIGIKKNSDPDFPDRNTIRMFKAIQSQPVQNQQYSPQNPPAGYFYHAETNQYYPIQQQYGSR